MVRASQENSMGLGLKHFHKRGTSSLILAVQMITLLFSMTGRWFTCIRDPRPHFPCCLFFLSFFLGGEDQDS